MHRRYLFFLSFLSFLFLSFCLYLGYTLWSIFHNQDFFSITHKNKQLQFIDPMETYD